ncbi:carbohydrate ABC transporter permease [Microbacterium sp.]|uniref:carbohydrate ABC transporter permease n=1 Tax=Microbacterium sp. TaxID=51671 RepID=UPI0039E2897A
MKLRRRGVMGSFLREASLLIFAALWAAPFYLLISGSLRTTEEIYKAPFGLPTSLNVSSFGTAWSFIQMPTLPRALLNTAIMTVGTVIVLILLSAICAYVIARRSGWFAIGVYGMFLLAMALPGQVGFISVYMWLNQLGLLGTYAGVIVANVAGYLPMAVFLYTGFFRALSPDYEEASYMDGASRTRTFFRVVFPQLRAVTGTLTILVGIFTWNEFFTPLIILSGTENVPVTVTLYQFMGNIYSDWSVVFAVILIAMAPAMALFAIGQKYLIKGFTGGIKG